MSEPLLEALRAGDVDHLAGLLAAGADPNTHFKSRYGISYGLTPLQVAVAELYADGEEDLGGPIDAVVLLMRYGADVNGWDERRTGTPLLAAVKDNHIEAARILLAAGADTNVQDDERYSPLMICAENGFLEIARLLLHCGAGKTMFVSGGGGQGMHALGFAARELQVDMVRLLLAHGADPNMKDADGLTALDILQYASGAEEPGAQERLREIRRLLGDASV